MIKKIKNLIANTFYFFKFPYMVAKQRILLYEIDSKSSFERDLGTDGLLKSKLSLETISSLEEIHKILPKKFIYF